MPQCATSSLSLTATDLQQLNHKFETADPQEIVQWCLEHIPEGLVQSSAFGASGMVTLDMLYRLLRPSPPVPVLFIDTLYHFPETLQHLKTAKAHYGLDLRIFRPLGFDTAEEFEAIYGEQLWERDLDRYQQLTKVEPLQRALTALEVKTWLTGRRRDQAEARAELPIFERDKRGCLKVNPLANWSYRKVWKYIVEHQVPYNPLYDLGYTSIGDRPLTTSTTAGEGERAGRWRGSARTECGMHSA
ncbi:MAG TPA: phosphoadenosine phosphosulfate reductase [Stenomitos sp.]